MVIGSFIFLSLAIRVNGLVSACFQCLLNLIVLVGSIYVEEVFVLCSVNLLGILQSGQSNYVKRIQLPDLLFLSRGGNNILRAKTA